MKTKPFLVSAAAAAAVAVFAVPQAASAATTYSDSASGFEYSATSTEGKFSGTASGALPGGWQATVDHTPLSPNATVTGGDFYLTTVLNGTATLVHGAVAGGSVTRTNPGATGCVNQYYAVNLTLGHVTRNGSGSGSGSYAGTLVHHRSSVFGYCLTYSATIGGPLTLTF